MGLESFYGLVPDRVLAAVEVGGRRATGYALALNSLENRVYEVELEDDGPGPAARVVAKFYRPGRWSRAAILDEHAFLAELAEAELPVVPPMTLDGLGDGATLGDLAVDGGDVIHYALFPKARGRAPEELADLQLSQLGRLVARLHHVGARRRAAARPALTPETYGAASVRLLAAGAFIPDEVRPRYLPVAERLVAACARAFAATPTETLRLHGDCHLGNLLWGAAGPFFLDFDDFLHGPAVQDLWLIAPGQDAEGVRQREVMVDGYETMRAFDRTSLRLVEPLRALRILRYAAWIAQRWDDPSFRRMFPDFTSWKFWEREVQVLLEQTERVEAC